MRPPIKKSQIQNFRDTARALECDEDEGKFDAALSKIAKHKPSGDQPKEPAKAKKKSE